MSTSTTVRFSTAALACAIAWLVVPGNASATGIPVVDLAHTQMTAQGWWKQYSQKYTEYGKQLQQLATQMDHLQATMKQYQQMYVKGSAYRPTMSYRENVDLRFPERSLNEWADKICGTGPRNNPVGIQQFENCMAIVQTENRRYNAMRQFLLGVADNDHQLAVARAEREAIQESDQGALQTNSNKIASIQSKMENDLQNSKYTMDAYASVLAALNADRVLLARKVLTGDDDASGVQGAALKLALQSARGRSR